MVAVPSSLCAILTLRTNSIANSKLFALKIFLNIIALLFCELSFGQNLIPNPNFENYIVCPSSANQVSALQNWTAIKESPEYFNSCTTNPVCSQPSNFCGYQPALSGFGYCGMVCYYASVSPNGREYIGAQLNSTLSVGQKYFVTFSLSLSGRVDFLTGTNKFGCKLSTVPFIYDSIRTDNQPNFYTDSIITDTLNWITIRGSFIADSAYNYIAFGNFFVDSLTSFISFGNPNIHKSYYYIDDVCLSTDSLICNSTVGVQELNKSNRVNIYPNPFSNQIEFEFSNNEQATIILYNILSQQILQKTFTNSITLNTGQLSKGIYIYELRNKNGIVSTGKVIKQ